MARAKAAALSESIRKRSNSGNGRSIEVNASTARRKFRYATSEPAAGRSGKSSPASAARLRASRRRQGLSRPTADGLEKSLEPSAVLRNAFAPDRSPCRGLLEVRREGLRASRTTADGSEKSIEPSAVRLYAADAHRGVARRTADGVEKSRQASAVDREALGAYRDYRRAVLARAFPGGNVGGARPVAGEAVAGPWEPWVERRRASRRLGAAIRLRVWLRRVRRSAVDGPRRGRACLRKGVLRSTGARRDFWAGDARSAASGVVAGGEAGLQGLRSPQRAASAGISPD
jgi:hypothetical protein